MPELSTDDYDALARQLNMLPAKLRATFERQQVASFRVKELKVVARFMKSIAKFAHCQFRLNGRKEELASDIAVALSAPVVHSHLPFLPCPASSSALPSNAAPFQAPRWAAPPVPSPFLARPGRPPSKSTVPSPYYSQSYPHQQQVQHYPHQQHSSHPQQSSPTSPSSYLLQHPLPPNLSTPQSRVNEITQSPAFRIGRSPFCVLEGVLGAGFASARESTKFKFTLPPSNPQLLVHVRMFDTVSQAHMDFGAKSRVFVNGGWVMIPEPLKLSYAKKKGLKVACPLVVTEKVKFGAENVCEVILDPASSPHDLSKCLICVELVSRQSIEQLVSGIRTLKRPSEFASSSSSSSSLPSSSPTSSATPDPSPLPKCGLCGCLSNLQRCSRCKAQWYCGPDHQGRHWVEHRKVCTPPTDPPAVKVESLPQTGVKREHAADDDDELLAVENSVSLMCPLSLMRIKVPARGEACTHRRCFDLNTWLLFSDPTDIWQCPLCSMPLHPSQVVIDAEMKVVLEQTDSDIEAIRFKDDGTFEAVTEEKGPAKKKQAGASRPVPTTSIINLSDESDNEAPATNGSNSSNHAPSGESTLAARSSSESSIWSNIANPPSYKPSGLPLPSPRGTPREEQRPQSIWNVNPSGHTVDEAIVINSDED